MSKKMLKVIDTGVLTVKDIDKLKEFPKESGVQRKIYRKNVDRLKKSMRELYIPSVIKVNKDWFILDGQHSKQALMELSEGNEDLEIVYVMYDTEGKDREACTLLNTTNKNWEFGDWIETKANEGNKDYIWLRDFTDQFNIDLNTAKYIVLGANSGGLGRTKLDTMIKQGKMVITEEQRTRAIRIVKQLQEIEQITSRVDVKGRRFQNAFVKVALNEKYDHERMINKLEYQMNKLYKCSNQSDYVKMLKDIYNYRSKDKVEF